MKEVKITIRYKVTDDFYESEIKSMKKDIESGSLQREAMKTKRDGLKDVKATFEVKNL